MSLPARGKGLPTLQNVIRCLGKARRHVNRYRVGVHLFPVLFLSFLGVMVFAVSGVARGAQVRPGVVPTAVRGVIDLRRWNFEKRGAVELDGQWQFFWKQFVSPALLGDPAVDGKTLRAEGYLPTSFMNLPQPWVSATVDGKKLSPLGYATYHLHVLIGRPYRSMMLRLGGIRTAYICYVNGVRVAESGRLGTSRGSEVPSLTVQTPEFEVHSDHLDIVIQVANYYHYNPGIVTAVSLGGDRSIEYARQRSLGFDFLLIGAFLILGLYQIGLFLLRRQDRSALLFAVFCFLMVVRSYVTLDRTWELSDALPWWALEKIEYLTFTLGVPVFVLYVYRLFRREFHTLARNLLLLIAGLYSLLVIATPNLTYGRLLSAFQLVVLMTALYFFWVLAVAIRRRRADAVVFLVGYVIFASGVTCDILSSNRIVHAPPVFPYALFFFVLVQAVQLSLRFARVYRRVEYLSQLRARLHDANQTLRELSHIDPLTGAANRRSFDQFVREEWARGLRSGHPLSLLMIDIDGFKAYNDNYGHRAGDEILRRVADGLGAAMRRSVDFLARYGGEEFVVVLPNTSLAGAATVGEKLRATVEAMNIPHEYSPSAAILTVSVGAATTVAEADAVWSTLVDAADRALYRAKQAGRNRVSTVGEDLSEDSN